MYSEKLQQRILFYQTRISDIKFGKEQQWRVVYLTSIAISGIIAFWKLIEEMNLPHFRLICSIISLLTACFGVFFLWNFGKAIKNYRMAKDKLFELFNDEEGKRAFNIFLNGRETHAKISEVTYGIIFSSVILLVLLASLIFIGVNSVEIIYLCISMYLLISIMSWINFLT